MRVVRGQGELFRESLFLGAGLACLLACLLGCLVVLCGSGSLPRCMSQSQLRLGECRAVARSCSLSYSRLNGAAFGAVFNGSQSDAWIFAFLVGLVLGRSQVNWIILQNLCLLACLPACLSACVRGCLAAWLPCCLAASLPCCLAARLPGCLAAWLLGCWLPGCLSARVA